MDRGVIMSAHFQALRTGDMAVPILPAADIFDELIYDVFVAPCGLTG